MTRPDDIPEWAWEEADNVGEKTYGRHARGWIRWPLISIIDISPREIVARSLLSAERRGIERAADAYRDGAGPEDGKWDHFLSAELAMRLLGGTS